MIYYVTAKDTATAKRTAARLQADNLTDCYITPMTAICCMSNMDIPLDAKLALRLDLMTVCDALIVKPPVSEEMSIEVSLAKKINMEVIYLDN